MKAVTETPVTESPLPADTRPVEVKALTTHLDSAELRAAVAAELAEAREREEAPETKLPGTLKETLAILREVQATPVPPVKRYAPMREAAAKRAKLKRIVFHLHSLAQGAATPPINVLTFLRPPAPHPDALARIQEMYPKPAKSRNDD